MAILILCLVLCIIIESFVIVRLSQAIDDLSDQYLDLASKVDPPPVFEWDYTKEQGWRDTPDEELFG